MLDYVEYSRGPKAASDRLDVTLGALKPIPAHEPIALFCPAAEVELAR